ncbi:hypothetical protein LEP1GSC068_1985 [Leptospira sp. Fiocruz LV3954]|nr:hypothetical protein LEP1GSC068_1985 [Leptospira sp. Fiocruz LV3954]EMI69128.1 hypothetical protein LEP1GSC076_2709 [Leptospira sp. Fiocruz LV4135]
MFFTSFLQFKRTCAVAFRRRRFCISVDLFELPDGCLYLSVGIKACLSSCSKRSVLLTFKNNNYQFDRLIFMGYSEFFFRRSFASHQFYIPRIISVFDFHFYTTGRKDNRSIIGVIAILISFSIVWDSYEMNLLPYPAGYFKVYYRQLILRPDTLDFFGSTSGIFRSGGLLGIRPHESGSLLAVVITLFLGLGIRSKSLLPKEFLIVFLFRSASF